MDDTRLDRVIGLQTLFTTAATVAAAVAAAAAVVAVTRTRPSVGLIRMGPGGWVSIKGPAPALHPAAPRPWWAHLLRARRLVVER
jgi:hypothetical protein